MWSGHRIIVLLHSNHQNIFQTILATLIIAFVDIKLNSFIHVHTWK